MKRKRSVPVVPVDVIDAGPPERSRHHKIVVEPTGVRAGDVRIYNRTSNPLDSYHYRDPPWITQAQWLAGDTFRTKFELAGMSPGVTGSFEPTISGSRDFTEAQLRARDEVNTAIKRLGPVGASIALNVCCYGIALTDIERSLLWRSGYGMIRLREALNELGVIFGIVREQRSMRIMVAIGDHLGVAPETSS